MNVNNSLAEMETVFLGRLAWVVPLAAVVAVTATVALFLSFIPPLLAPSPPVAVVVKLSLVTME